MKFRLEVQTWCSDLMFRLEFRLGNLQSQIEDWRLSRTLPRESSIPDWRFSRTLPGESSIPDWRLKIEDFPGLSLENLQSRIEDFPGLSLENLQSRIEDWRFSRTLPGESSIPDWRLKIFSWIKDSPTRVLRNLQSSIFNPGLKILQQESWGIFNLQSSIQD